jgi:hypothetical protein
LRNLKPRRCSADRTARSGVVSVARLASIFFRADWLEAHDVAAAGCERRGVATTRFRLASAVRIECRGPLAYVGRSQPEGIAARPLCTW